VHLVYVPNTRCRPLGAGDIDLLCQTIARTFPSATVQTAEGIHESRRRSMLIGRIRTDSSDAVVDLAQRLCIAFNEPFVGVEVDGDSLEELAPWIDFDLWELPSHRITGG
jgi:hypothetical protein